MQDFRSLSTGGLQCPHTSTTTELMPHTSRHYGKLLCASCGEFLKFLPWPESAEKKKLSGFRLTQLVMHPHLNEWERRLVDDMSKQGSNLDSRQRRTVDALHEKYFGKGVSQ
jgi:hypothetical protein